MNIFEHGYKRKNGMIYLNIKNLMSEDNHYNTIIRQYITKINFRAAENTRLILCEEGCNAIFQL